MAIERHPLPAMPDPRDALAVQREAALSELLLARGESSAPAEDRIDLKTLWRALARHRRLILGVTALFTLAAGLYTLRITPQYESTVMLQIDRAAQHLKRLRIVGRAIEFRHAHAPQPQSWKRDACLAQRQVVHGRSFQGMSSRLPVVRPEARSSCARAASARG